MTLSVLCLIPAFFAKSKTTLFLFQAISQLFFCLQYAFLFAYAGLFNSSAEFIRISMFYFYEKHQASIKPKAITCAITFCFSTILTIITWQAWYSILPILGLLVLYTTQFSKKLSIVKLGMFTTFACSFTYLILIGTFYGATLEFIATLLCLFGTIKDARNKQ